MRAKPLYLEPHQYGVADPPAAETALADALERLFERGEYSLDAIVAHLNASPVPAPGGGAWTAEGFCAEMKRLGAV